ncbi:MAG: glycosyltransferase family 39 protein [Desulfobacterales bacterium]|nr:glycosyltransferase family 39 protein [Desulfobacterales bacterium]
MLWNLGVNLITTDNFSKEDGGHVERRTASVQAAIHYYVRRGDLKEDTTWKWQPWGQFVVAAASLKMLGDNTAAARLPFALAGVATVLLLYRLVRRQFDSVLMSTIAAVMLAANAYWALHSRQCRYNSLSGLFLVLTPLFRGTRHGRGGQE